jgi:enterochelin esterase-like enzyme
MNRTIGIVALIITLSDTVLLAGMSQPWNNPSGGTLPTGCRHLTFYSAANKTTIGYIIYFPPGYDSSVASTVRYPVVYSFHGMGGNEWGNVAFASTLQSNIASKTVNPMIMVFVNGRGNSFYADSKDGSVKCETSIVKELLPHVDSLFHTIPDRRHRAAHGISMGGFGAMMMAFKHFDLFSQAVPNIPATVDWDTLSTQQFDQSIPKQIFGSDSNYFNDNYYPFTFVKKNADSLKAMGMKVHMADNPGDVTMGPLYSYNVAMYKLLKSKEIYVEFDSTAGSGHSAVTSGSHAVDMLKFISVNFASATSAAPSAPRSAAGYSSALHYCRVAAFGNFVIPREWRAVSREVVLLSILGREMGGESIEGKTMLNVGSLSKRYGAGVIYLKLKSPHRTLLF